MGLPYLPTPLSYVIFEWSLNKDHRLDLMKIHPISVYCGFKTALNQEMHYLFEIDLLAQILIF